MAQASAQPSKFERLAAIAAATPIPLVIHGGTELSDESLTRLIDAGVAKINYYTVLADAAAQAIRSAAAADDRAGYTRLTHDVRAAIRAEAERVIRLFRSAGRGSELFDECRPWREVEHVILFNANADEAATKAMKEEGRRVLGAIPGVREAATGTSRTADPRYRHCWLVRFCGEPVIDAYKHHADHQRFADEQFRPIAADRVTIDFELD